MLSCVVLLAWLQLYVCSLVSCVSSCFSFKDSALYKWPYYHGLHSKPPLSTKPEAYLKISIWIRPCQSPRDDNNKQINNPPQPNESTSACEVTWLRCSSAYTVYLYCLYCINSHKTSAESVGFYLWSLGFWLEYKTEFSDGCHIV